MRNPHEKHLKPSQLDALKLLRRVGGITVVEAAQLGVLDLKKRVSELINDHAYIVPGLGDAGDRIFGTKG